MARATLRTDLLSSFHYGLQTLDFLHTSWHRGDTIENWESLDATFDRWFNAYRPSAAAQGFAYVAADESDHFHCDRGRAMRNWRDPMEDFLRR
ncbi:hypothetical protein EC912_101791 [Luteibacter rhizovicinus]|uniref:Uncharacterized protein n=1 Tax=Luteibacter rhizovicinus TaxID=242606 RepID=A0A4R3Z1P1_9GAMM|nr:hypothetical protein EC912_101791 [Luteibacter rhizovicinus]